MEATLPIFTSNYEGKMKFYFKTNIERNKFFKKEYIILKIPNQILCFKYVKQITFLPEISDFSQNQAVQAIKISRFLQNF